MATTRDDLPETAPLPEGVVTDDRATELMQTLHADAYLSEEHFDRERRRIFQDTWFLVGRTEALPERGSYLHADVAGASVVVVRTREGDLRAFHNVCRHRGSQLVTEPASAAGPVAEPSGRFKGSIRCPYHAWVYGLDGELRNAPFLQESDGLRQEELRLYPVDVATWGGFVFVDLGGGSAVGVHAAMRPTLADHLGEAIARTANYPLANLRTGRRDVYDVEANWKVIVENYNECYHCGPVHPELCELVPAFKQEGGRDLTWEDGIPHREGATTFTMTGTTQRAPFPGLTEDEKVRHKGELLYPNLMLSLAADHVGAFTLWPISAGRTRIVFDLLFAPDEMARPGFDPSDAGDFWDLVNRQDWEICESVQRGMASPAFEHGYYAPMEDLSLDIRHYMEERLGPEA